MKNRSAIHPGEILKEEFLVPAGVTTSQLASMIDVPPDRITAIVDGRDDITTEDATLLARTFGTTPDFWLNLQAGYDGETCQ